MTTFNQLISSARVVLNDTSGTRYTDAQMVEYANDGLTEIYRIRPDLRFGSYTTAVGTYVGTDTVPIADTYAMFLKDYLVFRGGLREDEQSSDIRSTAFFSRFRNGLVSI